MVHLIWYQVLVSGRERGDGTKLAKLPRSMLYRIARLEKK